MKVGGTYDLPLPPEQVWQAFTDSDVLAEAVPGCVRVRLGPPLQLTTQWRVAALDGLYDVRADADAAAPPESATVTLRADGDPGTLRATVQARLEARDGGTHLAWEADCDVHGRLAAIGGQILAAAVRRTADAVLERVAARLEGRPAAAPAQLGPAVPPAPLGGSTADWGPMQGGARPDTGRVVLAGLLGAVGALLVVWLAHRLRGRR